MISITFSGMSSRTIAVTLLLATLAALPGCGRSRAEYRQQRLETFLSVLPTDVREAFDRIEDGSDIPAVGAMLHRARQESGEVEAALDSIMAAELIPLFSDTEVVEFFWVYFDHALETGTVPEP